MRRAAISGLGLGLALAAGSAGAVEMSSASYRIVGSNFNAGGHAALVPTAPSSEIGSLGSSIGQSEALGFSGSTISLRSAAPGFWPIVGGGFPHLDADLDAIQAFRDNCPFAFNPTQVDSGGIDTVATDGVGDACQCGDVDDDGIVDDLDVGAFRTALASPVLAPLPPAGVAKCSVIDSPGPCEVLDVSVTRRALVPLAPSIEPVCAAARP